MEESPPKVASVGQGWWRGGLILGIVIAYLYSDILARLVRDWWNDPDFSHGFLIPPFSAFVLWRDRRRWLELRLAPSWLGLPVVGAAVLTLIVGVLGAELFLSRSSFLVLLAGLTIYFLGWSHFRAVLFPWAFLFLMIPIPAIIFNQIAFPLQLLASTLASGVLELVGVPVMREGNVMHLASTSLEVAEACSGIRSLMSLVALAVIYAYFIETRNFRRTLYAVAAVPIAVVANGFRVVGTGLVAHFWDPEKAEGFFHIFSGWVIFVLAMTMLFSLDRVLHLADRWWGPQETRGS